MLQVYPAGTATTTAATNLWFFDSGDVECEGRNVNNNGCVDGTQLAWLRNHTAPPAPFGLAWVHIPVPEVMAVWSNTNSTGHANDTVCCSAINAGLYSELLRRGDVHAVFSGHDHYNDYFGDPTGAGLLVGYGRKTGMSGGTGPVSQPAARQLLCWLTGVCFDRWLVMKNSWERSVDEGGASSRSNCTRRRTGRYLWRPGSGGRVSNPHTILIISTQPSLEHHLILAQTARRQQSHRIWCRTIVMARRRGSGAAMARWVARGSEI